MIIMKKSAKLLSMILAASMVMSMAACSGGTKDNSAGETTSASADTQAPASDGAKDNTEAADSADGEKAASGETYTVGICQLVQHDALDAATQGFKDALTEELGDAVTFDEQNAQGDSNTCSTIINSFVST